MRSAARRAKPLWPLGALDERRQQRKWLLFGAVVALAGAAVVVPVSSLDTRPSAIAQAAESARNYAGYAANRMRDGYNRVADQFDQGFDASREMIRDYPGRAVATAFGVGLLMGVVVGLALRSR